LVKLGLPHIPYIPCASQLRVILILLLLYILLCIKLNIAPYK
jgi:hypothetical protein